MRSGRPRWWETGLGALVATVFNWAPWQSVRPGLDPSWQAGLAVAFTRHFRWGPQIDFTYGPYGFAGFLEPFYRSTSAIAFLYGLGVTWLLAALLVTGFRRAWGGDRRRVLLYRGALPLATLAAWAVIALAWEVARTADFASVVGLGIALELLAIEPGRLRTLLFFVLGALGAFALLVKLNTGLVVLGLLVVCIAGSDPGRRLKSASAGALAALVTFATSWSVAGQGTANLARFFHVSAELVAGYSSAMGQPLPTEGIVWWAIVVATVVAGALVAATRHPPRRRRAAALVMLAGWGWSVVKDGFVAGNHFPEFFRLLLVAAALSLLWTDRRLLSCAAVAAAAVAAVVVSGVPPIRPWAGPGAVAGEVVDLVDGSRFSHLVATQRRRVLAAEHVPSPLLAAVGTRSVAIAPWEEMVAWAAPSLRWDPQPVLQSYSAFTAALDHLDASFMTSPRAPQAVLYSPTGFGHRDPAWDPPATMETIYCRYREMAAAGPWEVLVRVPDRCGTPRPLGAVVARFGEPIPVPTPGRALVVATFSITATLASEMEGVLLKPPATWVTVWSEGTARRYRLVTGTAGDPHVLVAPAATPGAAGVPPRIDRLEISGGGWQPGTGEVSVHFYVLPLAGWARQGPEP